MMKHLQEPPPSILEERKDLPAGVGRVIVRALAKRPEDRYQKAGELYEALNAAATAEEPTPSTSAVPTAVDTGRIIVPTGANEPARTTLGERDDEATVVSADYARPRTDELPPPVAPVVVENAGFSLWRIAVPALAALAIIFAVVYAMQSRSGPASSQEPTAPLQADPNGQPVQSITPPTGQAEHNLVPASATPTPAAGEIIGGPVTTTPSGNVNAAPGPAPGKENANQNPKPGDNANDQNDAEPEATPTPEPRPKHTPEPTPGIKPTPVPPPEKEAKPAVTPDKSDKPPKLDEAPPTLGDAPPLLP
jgi:serine/threonine-protein kinase